jgi:hypothetical protein
MKPGAIARGRHKNLKKDRAGPFQNEVPLIHSARIAGLARIIFLEASGRDHRRQRR